MWPSDGRCHRGWCGRSRHGAGIPVRVSHGSSMGYCTASPSGRARKPLLVSVHAVLTQASVTAATEAATRPPASARPPSSCISAELRLLRSRSQFLPRCSAARLVLGDSGPGLRLVMPTVLPTPPNPSGHGPACSDPSLLSLTSKAGPPNFYVEYAWGSPGRGSGQMRSWGSMMGSAPLEEELSPSAPCRHCETRPPRQRGVGLLCVPRAPASHWGLHHGLHSPCCPGSLVKEVGLGPPFTEGGTDSCG